MLDTCKTKLKLDKEVGGGDLSELCTITYLIAYPYAWTVNFEICLDAQLRTYQPPIPKPSQASAWPYMYIGHWVCKTEGSPTGFARISKGWMAEKIPRQKWSISYLWEHFLVPEHRIQIWLGFKFIINGNLLIFHWFYWYFEFMNQSQVQKCFKSLRFSNQLVMDFSISFPKSMIVLRSY